MIRLSRLFKGECVRMDTSGIACSLNGFPAVEVSSGPVQELTPQQEEIEIARRRAKVIVDSASHYTAKMRDMLERQAVEARLRAEEAYSVAQEEGFRQGYQDGQTQALNENQETLSRIAELLQRIDQDREELLREYREGLVELALDIAGKVVGVQLSQDDQAFLRIFQKAVDGLYPQRVVKLTVSGHEAEFVTASSEYLRGLIHGAEHLEIEIKEDAPAGTCIVETEDAYVDASAERQLQKLEEAVRAAR